jgi:hypothetical protein
MIGRMFDVYAFERDDDASLPTSFYSQDTMRGELLDGYGLLHTQSAVASQFYYRAFCRACWRRCVSCRVYVAY